MKIKKQRETLRVHYGPITDIILHPHNKNRVLLTGSQGKVCCYNLMPFSFHQSFKLFNNYSTCVYAFGEGICVGSSSGDFIYLNLNGQIIKSIKLYNDCLSSIAECDNYLVTTSYDGVVKFLNKITFEVERQVDVSVPIWKSIYFQNQIYVAGNPSYSINCTTFQIQKLKRFDSFAVFNNKLYACSDQRGLTCLKNNSNSYIPCNFILPLQKRLMLFSEECATEIKHESQMEWKCHRIKQIEQGIVISSGCSIGNIMILGDNQGSVYKFEFEFHQKHERAHSNQI